MRVAGVRLSDGRIVWVDAEDRDVAPLDRAVVRLSEGDFAGSIIVTPEQLLRPPERVDGTVLEISPAAHTEEHCNSLPGSDLPFLGSMVRTDTERGRVTSLDPVRRVVTLTRDDGSQVEVRTDDVLSM